MNQAEHKFSTIFWLFVKWKSLKLIYLFKTAIETLVKMWNIFIVNNKDTRITWMTSLWCLFCYIWRILHLFVVFLLLTLNKYLFAGYKDFQVDLLIYFEFWITHKNSILVGVVQFSTFSWKYRTAIFSKCLIKY